MLLLKGSHSSKYPNCPSSSSIRHLSHDPLLKPINQLNSGFLQRLCAPSDLTMAHSAAVSQVNIMPGTLRFDRKLLSVWLIGKWVLRVFFNPFLNVFATIRSFDLNHRGLLRVEDLLLTKLISFFGCFAGFFCCSCWERFYPW